MSGTYQNWGIPDRVQYWGMPASTVVVDIPGYLVFSVAPIGSAEVGTALLDRCEITLTPLGSATIGVEPI